MSSQVLPSLESLWQQTPGSNRRLMTLRLSVLDQTSKALNRHDHAAPVATNAGDYHEAFTRNSPRYAAQSFCNRSVVIVAHTQFRHQKAIACTLHHIPRCHSS